jgi:SAM-dependent methyltransferase
MPSFSETQRAHAANADPSHFQWQTTAPYFADTEARLIAHVDVAPGERLLEVGCGEGGNLHHLRGRGAQRFGVDFSPAKAAFAARAVGAPTAVAEAEHLPFADASFDVVLMRDILHHVRDRARALGEAHRVLRAGGRITVIEPNARSPLVMLQAAFVRAERGLLRSTDARLRGELAAAGFRLTGSTVMQPLPIWRVVLHPKIGGPRLGAMAPVAQALASFDSLAARLVPRQAWMYLVYQAVKS